LVACAGLAAPAAAAASLPTPFAGDWSTFDGNGTLALQVTDAAHGVAAVAHYGGPANGCSSPTVYYVGAYTASGDSGQVAGCTTDTAGRILAGYYGGGPNGRYGSFTITIGCADQNSFTGSYKETSDGSSGTYAGIRTDSTQPTCNGTLPPPSQPLPSVPLPTRFNPGLIASWNPALAARFRTLLGNFFAAIPSGTVRLPPLPDVGLIQKLAQFVPLGGINNLVYGQNQYACGNYQGDILSLLDRLRFSSDPAQRLLVQGLDYGPIEVWYDPRDPSGPGGHQAVVAWPHGTDWKQTGVVLDPWIAQQPNVYSVSLWSHYFFSQPPRPAAVYHGQYPLTGGKGYTNPYVAKVPDLAPSRRLSTASVSAARPGRRRAAPTRRVVVVGPLTVLLHDGHGGVIGRAPNRRFLDTSRVWVDASALPRGNGYATTMMFPPGRETLTMHAVAAGVTRVYSASGHAGVRGFGAIQVRRGEDLVLAWPPGTGAPVLVAGRKVILGAGLPG
jgi:hypothetical protein